MVIRFDHEELDGSLFEGCPFKTGKIKLHEFSPKEYFKVFLLEVGADKKSTPEQVEKSEELLKALNLSLGPKGSYSEIAKAHNDIISFYKSMPEYSNPKKERTFTDINYISVEKDVNPRKPRMLETTLEDTGWTTRRRRVSGSYKFGSISKKNVEQEFFKFIDNSIKELDNTRGPESLELYKLSVKFRDELKDVSFGYKRGAFLPALHKVLCEEKVIEAPSYTVFARSFLVRDEKCNTPILNHFKEVHDEFLKIVDKLNPERAKKETIERF